MAAAVLLLTGAVPAAAYDDLAVEEKALRVMDQLVPSEAETKEKGMAESAVPGWIKVSFEAKSRRGWIPIEVYVHEDTEYALVGRLMDVSADLSPREKADKAAGQRLPDRLDHELIQEEDAPMEGLRLFLYEVRVPQRGPQPMAVYVGDDLAVVGQLFGPANQNLTEVAQQRWRASQVEWAELIKGLEPVYGSADADVQFAMFTDPDCPSCQRAKGRIDELVEEHGDDIAGYLLWLPLDMHPHAKPKAKVLTCSPAGKQAALFDALKDTKPEKVADVYTILEGKDVALPDGVKDCIASGKADKQLKRFNEHAGQVGVHSVPSVYFDDRLYKGFPESAIRSGLEAAR
jgi:hypothetical protein